ncbi:MAG: beta-N-acetylhexosaminidase [Deltaproteobacteria bacterium]|nr:beta-N-acetylhexosaminidase [Deltaproteobacteria bacterium]
MPDRASFAERIAGRIVVAGFDGTELPHDLAQDARRGALGGLVLFKRNVESHAQVAALLAELAGLAPEDAPSIAAVDQEGGRVVRLREPLTVLPPMRALGRADDAGLTRDAGLLVGRELCALGFTLDFAPVLDLDTNPKSPVIGDRSFGADPRLVARHGLAFASGLREGGVWPCAKHFPGHGDATVDSHEALPRVTHEADRLRSLEMAPFAAWAAARSGPIMTAHIVCPALDPALPATMSAAIVTGELRERLGFDGPVLSDDLEMGAIAEMGGPAAAAVSAVRAGVDGLLVCRSLALRSEVIATLAREATDDPVFSDLLERAAARLSPLGRPCGPVRPLSWIGSDEHICLKESILSRLGRS